jgi:hypothetical protein
MARRLVRIRLDPHVERPWQRTDFRHPDLMTWVRANRPRLVAACLTLCQAWIATGKPRASRTIGSYENWAQIIGGVLEVAGIPGFLGNLDEMMEASDSEGAGWSAFIAAWWDRFGTAEVGAVDLFDVALFCDPTPPITGQTERAQRTGFGIAIKKLRDRVFQVGDLNLRLVQSGTFRRAVKWQLKVSEQPSRSQSGAGGPGECEPRAAGVNLQSRGSHDQAIDKTGKCEPCEPCEPLPTLTRARARTHVRDDAGKGSQGSQGSQSRVNSEPCRCEPPCEPPATGSRGSPPPDWLRELDP